MIWNKRSNTNFKPTGNLMLNSRQSRRFDKRMDSMQSNVDEIGIDLVHLNGELKTYVQQLNKQIDDEDTGGRKEARLVSEVDRCEDLLDKIDDLSSAIGVDVDPPKPIELAEVEEEEDL